MGILRKTFINGTMNSDLDERVLPDGTYVYAKNVEVLNSENSDIGSIQNSYSNKKLTSLNLGAEVFTIGWYGDEFRDKLYWATKSELGCFVVEWDNKSQTASIVLGDTRDINERVLNFNENFLCTGWEKIITDNIADDLMLMTDDNLQPLCFNIERAKGYGINGFTNEDIFLIKKPPRFAPTTQLTYSIEPSNNIEEIFPLFAYRYQYLDNEWSALSSYSNYKFSPKPYKIDYYTLDNNGMVNNFNAVNIGINTGSKIVKAIQVIYKETNSNTLYIIETFYKKEQLLGDNFVKNFTFSNNKRYTTLPEEELYRTSDRVPLKAKSLTLIDNIPVFGDYLEGFNIVDNLNKAIKINYEVFLNSERLNVKADYTTIKTANYFTIQNPNLYALKKGNKLIFFISINQGTNLIFNKSYEYDLITDFLNINDLFQSSDFLLFVSFISSRFKEENTYALNGGVVSTQPEITILPTYDGLTISSMVITNGTTVNFKFNNITNVLFEKISSSASCKSNRGYEVGLKYLDDFDRDTTVLTCQKNTIYIPNEKSEYKNSLLIKIKNKPPAFADRYKIVVKTPALSYYTITVNTFYQDGAFIWIKLEGSDKDKVKSGDYLILKRTPEKVQSSVIKSKVLEASTQPENFLSATPGSEPSGYYIKIKPNGFVMNANALNVRQNNASNRSNNGFPTCYLDLFSVGAGNHLNLVAGSKITLRFDSSFEFDSGWSSHIFEREYTVQRDYSNNPLGGIKEWFEEVVFGTSMPGGRDGGDYLGNVTFINDSQNGKNYLAVTGLNSAGSGGRGGFVDAQITIRESKGDYIFETEPKKSIEQDIFFETEQTFNIINGQHLANIQDQNGNAPAIINLDFFNCFSMGNGVESYMIKDSFNKPFLNIDSRPSTTSIEQYKQVKRYADLTYGESYVGSSGLNGINSFNVAKANFKELDKKYGSVQKLISRDNDIIVFQEEKTSKVLFGKDFIYNADGNPNLTTIPEILGRQVPYMGENGVGKNPESIAIDDYKIYYTNPTRGIIQRLSNDGVTDITKGMVNYFRDLFINKPNSKKLGGFDSFFKKYVLSVGNQRNEILVLGCGNIVSIQTGETFSYTLQTNNTEGIFTLNYNIVSGYATIEIIYGDNGVFVPSTTGIGSINIQINNIEENTMTIIVTPIGGDAIFTIENSCPIPRHFSPTHFSSLHFST